MGHACYYVAFLPVKEPGLQRHGLQRTGAPSPGTRAVSTIAGQWEGVQRCAGLNTEELEGSNRGIRAKDEADGGKLMRRKLEESLGTR